MTKEVKKKFIAIRLNDEEYNKFMKNVKLSGFGERGRSKYLRFFALYAFNKIVDKNWMQEITKLKKEVKTLEQLNQNLLRSQIKAVGIEEAKKIILKEIRKEKGEVKQ